MHRTTAVIVTMNPAIGDVIGVVRSLTGEKCGELSS
jgi:hypothetical protein